MLRISKRLLSLLLALTLILSMTTVALAKDYDLINKNTQARNDFFDLLGDIDFFIDVLYNPDQYVIEVNGEYYEVEQVDAATQDGTGIDEAVVDLLPVDLDTEEELKVVSVSAITGQVIPAGIETELKFLVNGKETLTAAQFAEKYGEEGYTVEFKYNFSNPTDAERAGKVKDRTADFKYAVQVEDAEGNLIPETVTAADFVDVKVVAANVATKVNSVALYKGTEEWTAATVAKSDKNVVIKAKEWENAFGDIGTQKDNNNIAEPTVEKVTSSDPTIAYYEYAGANKGINVLKAGTVTFTVKFAGIKETSTITVNVKDAQKVTSIKADPKTAKVVPSATVKFTLLDQDGEVMRSDATVWYTATLADAETEGEEKKLDNIANGAAEITAPQEAGVYTVNVYAPKAADNNDTEADKTKKLGSFTFEVIAVEGEIDEFEIVIPEDAKFEITVGEGGTPVSTPVDLTINGYIDGVKVDDSKVKEALTDVETDVVFSVKSTNEKVATAAFSSESNDDRSVITVTPVAAGTTTIKLIKTEGDMVTVLATRDITVETKVPQITTLEIADNKAAIEVENEVKNEKVAEKLTAGKDKDGNEIFKAYMIDELTLIELEGVKGKIEGRVIVKIADAFGGETFYFPIVITPETINATKDENGPYKNEDRKRFYVKYTFKDKDNESAVDVSNYNWAMQIKPDGSVYYLTASGDDCIWFPVSDAEYGFRQVVGTHTFYMLKDNKAYTFTIDYEEDPEQLPGTLVDGAIMEAAKNNNNKTA